VHFAEEMDIVDQFLNNLNLDTMQHIENQPHTVIYQRRLRQIFYDAATAENLAGRVDAAVTVDQFKRAFERAIVADSYNGGHDALCTPLCFRVGKVLTHFNQKEWADEANELCTNFFECISLIFPLDHNQMLQPMVISTMSKFIHHEEDRLKVVLSELLKYARARCFRIIPPLPVVSIEDILWDPIVRTPMDNLMARTGLVNVYGPRGSGKTTRVLGMIHELPLDVDACYIDLKEALNETDMMIRVAGQLAFNYSVYEDMYERNFERVIDMMNFSRHGHGHTPVIVLDGIDNHVVPPKKGAARNAALAVQNKLYAGLRRIVSMLNRHLKTLCLVIISTHPIPPDDLEYPPRISTSSVRIGELPVHLAQALASQFHPAGVSDLRKAGKNYAGTMVVLGEHQSFIGIRSVAKLRKNKATYSHVDYQNTVCEDIAISLTKLETQCALNLWRGMTHFDMGMGWVLCRKAFRGNFSANKIKSNVFRFVISFLVCLFV
jgi:hypothetical protein